ncbi:MAG: MATE family efflux transporter [Sphingomonadaceae bacterium]
MAHRITRNRGITRNRADWLQEFRASLALSWPLAAANLLQTLVHAIDVVFVARLGEAALAAASLSIALFGLAMWSLSGMTGIVAALIAEELGRKRHAVREVRRSARMGLWLAVLAGILGMGLCLLGEQLMRWTGQDEHIADMSGEFLRIIMWAMVPMLLANVLRNFVSALGRPIFATLITASAVLVSAMGNYAFVFGHWGAPELGLRGSAVASVVTSLYIFVAYIIAIQRDRKLRRYMIFGNLWRPEWQRFVEMVRLGTPIALTILAEAGLFSGAAFLMGRIGPSQLAGHTIALNLAALAFQIPYGIGQAATIRVGYHYGARDAAGVHRAGAAALTIAGIFQFVSAAAFIFMPYTLLRIYIDPGLAANAAMVGFALAYLQVAAAFQLVDGLQAVAAGALRGLQDTRIPMMIAIFSYWIPGMGISVWLGFYTPLSGVGIWIGLAAGLLCAAIFLLWRWFARERIGLVRH